MALKTRLGVTRTMDLLGEKVRLIPYKSLASRTSPVHVAHTRLRDTTPSLAHTHDFYEFFLIRKGAAMEYRPGSKERLPNRTLVFAPPSRIHCFACAPGCPETLFTNLAFSTAQFKILCRIIRNRGIIQRLQSGFTLAEVPIMRWERMMRRLDSLLPGSGLDFNSRDLIFKALFLDLAASLVEDERAKPDTALPDWLAAACRAMQTKENLCKGLPRFISLCNRSQEHVTRTARKTLKLSPTQFINRLRLKQISDTLSTTSESIHSLAFTTGFNNLAHFNALFKKEFGLTPRDYRKTQGSLVVPKF